MKNVEDDVYASMRSFYESIIIDSDLMKDFLSKSSDEEKINLYKFVCRTAAELKGEEQKDLVPFYWLASMELEHTEGVKKYLNGEITEEDLVDYEAKKQAEIEAIVELLEQKKKAKTPLGKLKRMFSPKNSKTK